MTWLLKGEPYEVQETALTRTNGNPHGFAYFMEMGLGKTAVILAEYRRLKEAGLVNKLVVNAPYSLLNNWAKEAKGWFTENDAQSVTVWPDKTEADIYVINYEAFAVGGATGTAFVRELCENHRVMLVLDESTQIKNNKSVRTKALLSLARSSAFTRILSGAPMIQGPHDLWAQLKFIGELKGVNYYQYRNKFCQMGGFQGKQILGPRKENLPELNSILDRSSFRAKKEDWLDLPPKTYYTRDVKLSPKYSAAYNKMARELLMEVEGKEVSAPMAITLMLKLQQISSGFIITDEGETIRLEGANSKFNEIINIIENEVDTKVIIPVYFQESQRFLLDAFAKKKLPVAKILSGMTKEEIEDEKRLFNEEDTVRIALAQTSSQKYGHTLLGTPKVPCHTTIFYENTFSLDDRLQMEDRSHRIGQRHQVNVIDFSCSPIEEKVIQSLQRKEDMAKVIVDAIKTTRL